MMSTKIKTAIANSIKVNPCWRRIEKVTCWDGNHKVAPDSAVGSRARCR
jgi:hypothetical protein